jgi:chondroitin 4-sulfotransferase 11
MEALEPFLSSSDVVIYGGEHAAQSSQEPESSAFCLRKHSTAEEIAGAVGEATWNSYFKFSFVRHPLDRLVSLYEFFNRVRRSNAVQPGMVKRLFLSTQANSRPSYPDHQPWNWKGMQALLTTSDFSGFIRSDFLSEAQGAMPQTRSLTDKSGNLLVDFVGKVENIADDWQTICGKFGIQSTLSRANQSKRTHDDLRRYWNKDDLKFVVDKYRADFELFAYSPDEVFER